MEPSKKEGHDMAAAIAAFDRRIEEMHRDFIRYRAEYPSLMPDWRRLERELLEFSRKKLFSPVLISQLDRVLHKFQNRKKIWLSWADEVQRSA